MVIPETIPDLELLGQALDVAGKTCLGVVEPLVLNPGSAPNPSFLLVCTWEAAGDDGSCGRVWLSSWLLSSAWPSLVSVSIWGVNFVG